MFLDFYDNCIGAGGASGDATMDTLSTTCRSTFRSCSARTAATECSPDATCTPLLDDLTCSKPPCMACVCHTGLMGDGNTCVPQPVFTTGPAVPADVASGNCLPVAVDGAGAQGQVTGSPGVYCLDARAGVTYTISTQLLGLSDSVLELWSPTAMIDSNDDFGGSLGSQLEYTAAATVRVYIVVRGYSDQNRGAFGLTVISSDPQTAGPSPPAGGAGADCLGCFYRGQCRAIAANPNANPATCVANGGTWQDAGSPCDGGVTYAQKQSSPQLDSQNISDRLLVSTASTHAPRR